MTRSRRPLSSLPLSRLRLSRFPPSWRWRVAGLGACAALAFTATAGAASPDSLQAIIADYEAFDRRVDPIGAGQNGDREALWRLPNESKAAVAEQRRELEGFARRLAAPPATTASGEDQLNRELLDRQVREALQAIAFDADRINFDSYSGFHLLLSETAQALAVRDIADARAWIARLRDVPRFYATEIANARRGAATGFTQPRPTVEAVLAVTRAQADDPPDGVLMSPLRALPPSISPTQAAALRAEALGVIAKDVKPAQRRLVTFLETEYMPRARSSLAARDLPNGAAYYRWLVAKDTTTDLTPDQIHTLGLSEVTRIRAEMQTLIQVAHFQGGFAAFQAFLRSDPQFYVTTPGELLARSAVFAKQTDEVLPRWFDRLPRLPFAVRPIPAESADGATTAYYEPGSPQLRVAGGYMVNTSHLDQRPLYELPALSLHESTPGHHLQIALAQERTDLPRFRRDAYLIAYVEGWALYAEQLGVEMGRYATPYEQFGRLSYEMWRACRLVADTGIHWLRWSRDQARQCFTNNTALTPKNIEVELDRYISWPGQALAYKLGELEIMKLRRRAEQALGPRFDIRRFHDAVLLEGPLPLTLLERRINAWIQAESAAPSPPG